MTGAEVPAGRGRIAYGYGVGDIAGVGVGHVTDESALTGCTAVVFRNGAVAGHVIAGVATGSRELPAFGRRHCVERVHGVCFSGGSAFGLAAASGVVRRLAAEGIGHPTSATCVPIVAGAVIYDLALGDPTIRPDEQMGEQAADIALSGVALRSGNVGAGTGASAGKLLGLRCATKTGLGHAGLQTDDGLQIAALVVLNPVGDVRDPSSNRILAGTRAAPDSSRLVGTAELIRNGTQGISSGQGSNTTLALVVTNAALSAVECEWAAEQATVALARSIDPPFTRHDGDIVICASVGDQRSDLHRIGVLARDMVEAAIVDACASATPAGGLPNGASLEQPD